MCGKQFISGCNIGASGVGGGAPGSHGGGDTGGPPPVNGRRRSQIGGNSLLDSSGATITTPIPSCTASNTFQTKITPFVTYTHTTVEDPINPLALWGMLGGALAVLDMLAAAMLVLTKPCCGKCEAKASEASTEVRQTKPGELEIVP